MYQRLQNEFSKLEQDGSTVVQGIIEKSAKIAKSFFDEMDKDDEEEDVEDSDDDDEESDDENDEERDEEDDRDP